MSQHQPTDSRQEFEYVYHWDRIIGAVAALLLVVAAIIWSTAEDDTPGAQEAASSAPATVDVKQPRGIPVEKPVDAHLSGSVIPPTAVTEAKPAESQAPTSDGVSAPVASASSGQAATTSVPAEGTTPGTSDAASVTVTADLRQGEVRVASPRITDAALNQIIDQELVAIPKGVIEVGQRKAVRLVFNARLPSPGSQVSFVWFHEGRQVVTVKTRVSPEGVATGSKYVSFDTPGQWQVKLTDADGTLLAEAAVRARRR